MAEPDELAENDLQLCSSCIRESYLSHLVENTGRELVCSYCGVEGVCLTIEQVADHVEQAFADHFTRTSNEPDFIQEMMLRDRESSYMWEREGEETVDAIAEAAGIASAPAGDIQAILCDRHADFGSEQECEFDPEARYEEKASDAGDWWSEWLRFETQLRTTSRFFSKEAAATLAAIFQNLGALKGSYGRSVIVTMGPRSRTKVLYRGRVFTSDDALGRGLSAPEAEIGPPPSTLAQAGRMSARGISVFYGATNARLALAETRPPVGSRVVIGRFDLLRPVRILDLGALKQTFEPGSLFDPAFAKRCERARFLTLLTERMLTPVMPGDEALDYLPTQVVADYLANAMEPPLDGIAYPSVQAGRREWRNVVLFHRSALVRPPELPVGTMVTASLHEDTDEGPEEAYTIWERVSKADDQAAVDDPFDVLDRVRPWQADGRGPIERKPTLALDRSALEVHRIEAVSIRSDRSRVAVHRIVEYGPDDEPFWTRACWHRRLRRDVQTRISVVHTVPLLPSQSLGRIYLDCPLTWDSDRGWRLGNSALQPHLHVPPIGREA